MTETVTISKVSASGKTLGNDKKPIFDVLLADGRTGISVDPKIKEYEGKEIAIDIREGKEYNNVKPVYFNLPPELRTSSKNSGTPKDWTLQKRITALECAARFNAARSISSEQMLILAEEYFNWLNKK